jgi:hypothetical protein
MEWTRSLDMQTDRVSKKEIILTCVRNSSYKRSWNLAPGYVPSFSSTPSSKNTIRNPFLDLPSKSTY